MLQDDFNSSFIKYYKSRHLLKHTHGNHVCFMCPILVSQTKFGAILLDWTKREFPDILKFTLYIFLYLHI